MSELIEQVPSKEEAQAWEDNISAGLNTARVYMLKIRDTKGYQALGFDSFESWGDERFGFKKSHLNRLCCAAEIQQSLESPMGDSIPERQLRPFAKVPEDERKEIWEAAKAEAQAENKQLIAKHVEDAVHDWEEKAKKSDQTIEEWRQQYLDERNSKRELNSELECIKASKKETIYIADNEKALDQYKEETDGKLKQLKADANKAQDELLAVLREKTTAIANGVNQELENYSDEIERLQKQETQLSSSIERLDEEWNKLDNSMGARKDHIEARKEYKNLLEQMAIKANILFDDDFTEEDKTHWLGLLKNTLAMVSTFDGLLNKA